MGDIKHFLDLDQVFYWILMFENLICMFPYFTLMYVIIFKEKKACNSTGIINIQLCIISIIQSISFSFAVVDENNYNGKFKDNWNNPLVKIQTALYSASLLGTVLFIFIITFFAYYNFVESEIIKARKGCYLLIVSIGSWFLILLIGILSIIGDCSITTTIYFWIGGNVEYFYYVLLGIVFIGIVVFICLLRNKIKRFIIDAGEDKSYFIYITKLNRLFILLVAAVGTFFFDKIFESINIDDRTKSVLGYIGFMLESLILPSAVLTFVFNKIEWEFFKSLFCWWRKSEDSDNDNDNENDNNDLNHHDGNEEMNYDSNYSEI